MFMMIRFCRFVLLLLLLLGKGDDSGLCRNEIVLLMVCEIKMVLECVFWIVFKGVIVFIFEKLFFFNNLF